MANKQLNQEQLSVLRKKLPHGSSKEIQRRTGLGATTISKALNGYRVNILVIEEAYKIANQEDERAERIIQKINELQ